MGASGHTHLVVAHACSPVQRGAPMHILDVDPCACPHELLNGTPWLCTASDVLHAVLCGIVQRRAAMHVQGCGRCARLRQQQAEAWCVAMDAGPVQRTLALLILGLNISTRLSVSTR